VAKVIARAVLLVGIRTHPWSGAQVNKVIMPRCSARAIICTYMRFMSMTLAEQDFRIALRHHLRFLGFHKVTTNNLLKMAVGGDT
jgi:hypothetical protein